MGLQDVFEQIIRRLRVVERKLNDLAPAEFGIHTWVDDSNVTSPPTDAELDAAFGTPVTVGEGFIALVDDNDAATTVWLVASVGGAWWYEQLTKAV